MLIYNFKKEFLGIDEKDLKTLGFKDLAGLRTEVTDFADLFVKTPGYVHNFKHVHWIDFITCAESSEESKVIINVNNKNYKCVLQITTTYLVDSPSSKAFIITLNNLRELNTSESERISGDITTREVPQTVVQSQQIFNTPELSDEFDTNNIEEELQSSPTVKDDPYETPLKIDLDSEDTTFEEEILSTHLDSDLEIDENLHLDDMSLDIDFEDDLSVPLDIEEELDVSEIATMDIQTVEENFDNGYVYNPQVASDELGLPLDLIEEFIQDFIAQAKEFKANLYQAVDEQDLDNLRILSHKLKGVAANLRVEDALEALTTINTSDDLNIIEDTLNTFYKIISKLAGEEISIQREIHNPPPSELIVEEESLDISFKDEIEDDLYADPIETLEKPLELLDVAEEEVVVAVEKKEEKVVYIKDNIANEIGIDTESFNELFNDYIKEAGELNKSIQSALENNDVHTCKSAALQLKGMSDNMRITTFSNDLEIIIHANNTQDIQDSLNNIVTAIAELSK
ncbi:Hpt domain-containing protein [Sulfurimonas sp. SAG-AH-194-C21]|nr:Hpt domain-containing protein [Sulfurimonas sp. SAG-AH-194-C21]MDF1883208.1 Hpt domain-containing protein [Sulfurimonas sp. SAG-AH-194-C21]